MDKTTFNQMPLEKQVAYINSEFSKGNSLRAIQKDTGIPRSTVQTRFTKNGYVIVNNEYVKSTGMETSVVQKEDLPKYIIEEPKQIPLLEEKPAEIMVVSENKTNNQDLIFSEEEMRILKELAKRELEVEGKKNTNVVLNGKMIKTTIRINEEVWNEFVAHAKESPFKQQDLLSTALNEYLARSK